MAGLASVWEFCSDGVVRVIPGGVWGLGGQYGLSGQCGHVTGLHGDTFEEAFGCSVG